MKYINISLGALIFMMSSCGSTSKVIQKKNIAPKNVILLISDGAGLSQISSAFFYKETHPNYARFKHIGLIKTSSTYDITDSAAGATAFACGEKTYNGAIGVSKDSTSLKNLIELVSINGINTGLIATTPITHATPASFYAHSLDRNLSDDIAVDLVESEVDFFAGGGLKSFNKRKDKRNLLNELKSNQFTIDTTSLGDFSKIKSNKKMAYLLAEGSMPKMSEGRTNFLSDATKLGIQFLDKDNTGFFMMSEGSQIDWGGHDNNASYLVSELIDFDNLIGSVLDYAEKDGNTLVIVTSDHETGGFALTGKKKIKGDGSAYNDYSEIELAFTSTGHSAALVPVFAYGPSSEEFNGIYENTEIFNKILKVTQWRTKK